jgi:tRNA-binding protein
VSIKYQDFEKVDVRVGHIIAVDDFPEARKPAFKLTVDFGSVIGIKRSSAQITAHYTKDELLNKKILAVVNFDPKQIGPFISEVLVVGTADANGDVILADPGKNSLIGAKLF